MGKMIMQWDSRYLLFSGCFSIFKMVPWLPGSQWWWWWCLAVLPHRMLLGKDLRFRIRDEQKEEKGMEGNSSNPEFRGIGKRLGTDSEVSVRVTVSELFPALDWGMWRPSVVRGLFFLSSGGKWVVHSSVLIWQSLSNMNPVGISEDKLKCSLALEQMMMLFMIINFRRSLRWTSRSFFVDKF